MCYKNIQSFRNQPKIRTGCFVHKKRRGTPDLKGYQRISSTRPVVVKSIYNRNLSRTLTSYSIHVSRQHCIF